MTCSLPLLAVAALASTAVAQVNWTNLTNTGAPPALCGYSWDTARNRLVAFGGLLGAVSQNGTTELVGNQWQPQTPALSPSARSRAAMAYDEANAQTVLFGGSISGVFSSQTWTWNGTTWTQRSPANVPPPRFGAAMAYDPFRQVVVLFGGFVSSGLDIGDVWEWNGTNWTQITVAGAAPQPRGAHRMVFDAARGVCLMYGGYRTPALSTLADCWSWNGTSWTQNPSTPGSLCDQVLAYDSGRQRVVLFGGLNIVGSTLTDLNQTWEWNGVSWTQRTTATTPSARSGGANGYDPAAGRVICGGGANAAGTQAPGTFGFAPTSPATAFSFGAGCASSAGPIQLDNLTQAYVGTLFEQLISGAPTNALIALLAFGESNTSWQSIGLPIDLTVIGANGCNLNVGYDFPVTVPLAFGLGSFIWNLPNLPSIVGAQFFTQAIVFDPGSVLAFPIAMSPGRGFVVGSP